MNLGEKRFREVFGPFLEEQGYHLKYGTYHKIEPDGLLIKQVFIRTIAFQWQICCRLATFCNAPYFKRAESGGDFLSVYSFEQDKKRREWLICTPLHCRCNYDKDSGVTKEEADAILSEAVVNYMDCMFALFRERVFDLLDSPKTLYDACKSEMQCMSIFDLAYVYCYLGKQQEALEALDHTCASLNNRKNKQLTPKENDARYNRLLEANKAEWAASWDCDIAILLKLKTEIEKDGGRQCTIRFKANVLENMEEMLSCRLLNRIDQERIIHDVIGNDLQIVQNDLEARQNE